MATRGASVTIQTEAAQAANAPIHLYELYLDGGTVRATDAWRSVDWSGNLYTAVGSFLSYDGLEDHLDLKVSSLRATLTGVDTVLVGEFLNHPCLDRRLVIRTGFMDAAGGVLVDPVVIFDGRCESFEINEDPGAGTCAISLSAASQWVDFERAPGRHTNHEEQQIWFPGDLGFEFIPQLNKELKWGAP